MDRAANQVAEICRRRKGNELADHRHRLLLRADGEWPSSGANDKRYERAAVYSITLSTIGHSGAALPKFVLRSTDRRAE
jgi:hypothetical protein